MASTQVETPATVARTLSDSAKPTPRGQALQRPGYSVLQATLVAWAAARWQLSAGRSREPAAKRLVPEAARLERFSISARLRSIQYALRGIGVMLRTQHNAWVHGLATVAAVLASIYLQISRGEWLAITLSIMAVWSAEALNTAFESLCDIASPEFHPMVERAKDVAAGAVLIAAIGAVFIGLLVFGPKLLALLA